ncbi:MAG: hypothetical protein ACK4OO_07395, partial [bacterium]
MISSYIVPLNPDIREILNPLVAHNNLIFVKDGQGRFWAVDWNFSNIRAWDPLGGYLIKVRDADSLIFSGERIPPQSPIDLNAGWNQIAYLLDRPVATRVAFEGILNDLLIVKDGWGRFSVPRWDFWGLATLLPGQGYQVKMAQRSRLIYQEGGAEVAVSTLDSPFSLPY